MLYFLALVSLSTSGNWAKLNQMPAEVLGFWRLAIATLILILYQSWRHQLPRLALTRQNSWVLISGFFFFLHLWTFKYAAKHIAVSNLMVLFASNPIWASVGGSIFFHEKIAPRVYWSYALALAGVIFLVANTINFNPEHTYGNMIALISAVFYAIYMLTGKKAREMHSNEIYSTYQYLMCALLFLSVALMKNEPLLEGYSAISWWSILGLVAFPTFLGHFLLTYLVKTMNLAILSCGKLIEPLIASVIAYFLFHETLSPSFFVSFILTSMSVIILFWPQIKKYLYTRNA